MRRREKKENRKRNERLSSTLKPVLVLRRLYFGRPID